MHHSVRAENGGLIEEHHGLWPHGRVEASMEENVNRQREIVMKFPWDRGTRGRLQSAVNGSTEMRHSLQPVLPLTARWVPALLADLPDARMLGGNLRRVAPIFAVPVRHSSGRTTFCSPGQSTAQG
jgi:hypothetical protein